MTVRMRHTRGHTANRRSHHALEEKRFSVCPTCKASHVRHTMCSTCGSYRGRIVIDVKAREERRLTRRTEKLKAIGQKPSRADATASSEK